MLSFSPKWLLSVLALGLLLPATSQAACCYFSAKNTDILQPAQKVFITWDPEEKAETFTVQPKFEGNALDFGMVIPTPTQPKLHEMPRDFFKHLAYYTIMKRREFPVSKLLPLIEPQDDPRGAFDFTSPRLESATKGVPTDNKDGAERKPAITI